MKLVRSYDKAPAVRHGNTFCSPRCGFGCTWAAHVRATREAEALAARLGHGWRPHVWENCGWNYEAIRGVCEIQPSIKGGNLDAKWSVNGYTAWIQTEPQYISSLQPTPEEALREAMMKMKAAFDALAASFGEAIEIGSAMKIFPEST